MEEPYCRGNSLPTAIHALRVAIDDDGNNRTLLKQFRRKGTCAIKSIVFAGVIACGSADYYRPDTETAPEEISSTTPPVPVRKKHKD